MYIYNANAKETVTDVVYRNLLLRFNLMLSYVFYSNQNMRRKKGNSKVGIAIGIQERTWRNRIAMQDQPRSLFE